MSLLKALGIDKYTTRFKQWIASKYVAKDNLKTINGESLEGEGNIEISGGGSSVNADWNQHDSTQPDYIKNRTHYYAEKLQYKGEIEVSIDNVATYTLSPYEYIDQDIYGYRVPDKIKFTGGGTSFTLDFIKEPIPGYNYEEEIQEAVIKRFTIDEDTDIEVRYYYNGNPDYIEGTIIELELIATNPNYQEYVTFVTEDYYVDLKQIDEKYIPDTIVRKSDLENTGSSSSNEYIITTFTYYNVKTALNESGYFEHYDNEVFHQIKANKTIYIKSDLGEGKILCNYINESSDVYRLICNDFDLIVDSTGTISCSSPSINHNAIITDFTADMIIDAYSDNDSVETYTAFGEAFNSNPIPIIMPKGYDNDGYVHALYVDGNSNYFNLGFIYHDYYYMITVDSDMHQISAIRRAPMPALE